MTVRRTAIAAMAAAIAFCMVAPSVSAQEIAPVAIRRVADRPEVQLDAAKAYLLVEAQGMFVSNFILLPTAEEQADWARQRSEALAEAVRRHPRQMQRYQRDLETWRATSRAERNRPELPIEPTDQSFAWPDIESRRVVTIGPQLRFRAEDGNSLWLYEVPAGDYVYYGTGLMGANECACMGTVRFNVQAGKVTALNLATTALDAAGQLVEVRPEGVNSNDLATRIGMTVTPPSPGAYDPRLPRDRVVAANLQPHGALPNWFGGLINRVLPVPGVLTYERGEVVGLRPGE